MRSRFSGLSSTTRNLDMVGRACPPDVADHPLRADDSQQSRRACLPPAPKRYPGAAMAGSPIDPALDGLLRSATEHAIVALDMDGKILSWNEGARRLYGYEPAEVAGVSRVDVLFTLEDRQVGKSREILSSSAAIGKGEGVLQQVDKGGKRVDIRLVVTPRRDASGRVAGYTSVACHLTGESRADR